MSSAHIHVVGHVGGEPEVRETQDGKRVVSFSVAHNPYRKDDDAPAIWYRVSCWRQVDFILDHVHKGRLVYVHGEHDLWHGDKGDQQQIKFATVQVMDWDRGEERGGARDPVTDDDIPF